MLSRRWKKWSKTSVYAVEGDWVVEDGAPMVRERMSSRRVMIPDVEWRNSVSISETAGENNGIEGGGKEEGEEEEGVVAIE